MTADPRRQQQAAIRRPVRRAPVPELWARPIAPVPAASETPNAPPLTEAECLALLVKRYRWAWVGSNQLRRYDPFGAMPHVRAAASQAAEALNCNGEGASHAA